MLGYLHEFHAGNHADILKHLTLVLILRRLSAKGKPYTFFDTHAGSALYDLDGESASKTGEAARGITRLLSAAAERPSEVPPPICEYLSIVRESLARGFYPGSPEIALRLLLPGSRLVLSELHSAECVLLKERMKCSCAQVHNRDGWELLNALTPPPVVRGAALCDPSYEIADDYGRAAEVIPFVHKKWNAASIALWYPLLSYRAPLIEQMKRRIISAAKSFSPNVEILDASLCVNSSRAHIERTLQEARADAENPPRLYGSGMLVIRPAWRLCDDLRAALPYLAEVLGEDGRGSWSVEVH